MPAASARCFLVALLVLRLAALARPASAAEPTFQDDFTHGLARYELISPQSWRAAGGLRFNASKAESAAIVNVDEAQQLHAETEVVVERRTGSGYALAGVTLYLDAQNYWRVMLVATPDDKTYFELSERRQGVHQAQAAPVSSGTRLTAQTEGDLRGWKYGQNYRVKLTLTPTGIAGEVHDPAGARFWRCTYSFDRGRAVRRGQPGLWAGNTAGVFRRLSVTMPPADQSNLLTLKAGPRGSVALVDDEAGRVAPVVAALLASKDYGVTRVSWKELSERSLPTAQLDLLLFADARRVPVAAAQVTRRLLRSQGKVLALGAPIFGQTLVRVGERYVPVEQFGAALYPLLDRRPLEFDAARWKRSCQNPQRPATFTAVAATDAPGQPTAGQAWKFSTELQGWDLFGQVRDPLFADGRTLLCFQAQGDATTPELAIECAERDGSRWIAGVELGPQLQSYVLKPERFIYWHDSKAKRGPTDRMNPGDVVDIRFGMSTSHTPRCKAGPHSFTIQNIATAVDPQADEPEVDRADIEGFCPSYKLYPVAEPVRLRPAGPQFGLLGEAALAWNNPGYAPVKRVGGLGFDRQRQLRLVPLLDAFDNEDRNRGALAWLVLGDTTWPGARWAAFGVSDPAKLLPATGTINDFTNGVLALVETLTHRPLLLEAGSRQFVCNRDEAVELGASVQNPARAALATTIRLTVRDRQGQTITQRRSTVNIPAGGRSSSTWSWMPRMSDWPRFPATVTTELLASDAGSAAPVLDAIEHPLSLLRTEPAGRDEFVTVRGSQFQLDGQPWFMRGINYWPNTQGGRSTVPYFQRAHYDPVTVERDLAWLESQGVNMLSGVQAPHVDPPQPGSDYRDLHDFLDRCRRHHMKVFYFLRNANPFAGGSADAVIQHITAAGIKDHPAILAWELSWEPIYYAGPRNGAMDFLRDDWNTWIVERYGSLAAAQHDWGHELPAAKDGQRAALPPFEWCQEHGPWDRVVAAFRRFFSDRMGEGYGTLIRRLRQFDPQHLVTFRFGACGIPDKARFAHAHSASVAKHVDFLCPEGYNLQPAQARPTPADDLRRGGLVTLFYRFLGREKPVVWMEFGYTVNGMHTPWKTGMETVTPAELNHQRDEYTAFCGMFLESGAQGAAPWWLPGGYRVDEQSDFGLVEPDGAPRPAFAVLRQCFERLPTLQRPPVIVPANDRSAAARPLIELDLDAHYADAWRRYSTQYLQSIQQGRLPRLATRGTGTNSADCPLVAVGNTPCTGANPPQFLNGEINALEIRESTQAAWREIRPGEPLAVPAGARVRCRVNVGNTGEATWLAPGDDAADPPALGRVYLACQIEPAGKRLHVPLSHDTPYLGDAYAAEFEVPAANVGIQQITLQLFTTREDRAGQRLVIPFGAQRHVRLNAIPR